MHPPDHADELPEHIDPIPIPATPKEAESLCLLLDPGLYPTCQAASRLC